MTFSKEKTHTKNPTITQTNWLS